MLTQSPEPGSRIQTRVGDTLTFVLVIGESRPGRAWLRTNLGRAARQQAAIIAHIEQGIEPRGDDWHDIPMTPREPGVYSLRLPMLESGSFEAKTLFQPDDVPIPSWPPGPNVYIKITSALTVASNTIYCAFVRQFGPHQKSEPGLTPERIRSTEILDASGYTVIPRSGTFRNLIRELDTIMGTMRFRILQLLPIFPAPTTYGRMGRFGSPFAVRDLEDVDPSLAEFDRNATPFMQFMELVKATHVRKGRLFLDIPINHTGWASTLQTHHPEWFVRNPDGSIQSPGAWGVTWEDLCKLDYSDRALWRHMAAVFLFWCRHGIDGFRCDAGYMVPVPVWQYIVATVRREYPDTTFLLEGLGGKFEVVTELLATSNLDWAYSELFQTYDQSQIYSYLNSIIPFSRDRGLLLHFAETHDNSRLAEASPVYARMRTALSAMCSDAGGFGITNGLEWLADRKIDVHGMTPLNWDSPNNQVAYIRRLNAILDSHPAFFAGATLRLIDPGTPQTVVLQRRHPGYEAEALVVINLDVNERCDARWSLSECDLSERTVVDLVSGRMVNLSRRGLSCTTPLKPGEVLCLVADAVAAKRVDQMLEPTSERDAFEKGAVERQKALTVALSIWQHFNPDSDLKSVHPDDLRDALLTDPDEFIGRMSGGYAPITHWQWPEDVNRVTPWPRHHILLIHVPHPFEADVCGGGRTLWHGTSLCLKSDAKGGHFMAILPPEWDGDGEVTLDIRPLMADPALRETRGALYRPPLAAESRLLMTRLSGAEARRLDASGLCTNGRGAMALSRAAWGEIRSKYEALLAANLHSDVPVDRQVMLTRIRGWVVRRGYSEPLDPKWLTAFSTYTTGGPESMEWEFMIPAGEGREIALSIRLSMVEGRNSIVLAFERKALTKNGVRPESALDDDTPIRLILRPDIEDRSCHGVTQAYMGSEAHFPRSITTEEQGFVFAPSSHHRLVVHADEADFFAESEWRYMCPLPVEQERGLDRSTDVFSPGYFASSLQAGQELHIHADVLMEGEKSARLASSRAVPESRKPVELGQILKVAMRQFIVKRDSLKTVIAGYPWFLDWGRDTLICLRGMIAAGFMEESREILLQFARLEDRGTLPNMIRGNDHSNRDTSDAPLWFLVACADWLAARNDRTLLDEDCGGRPLRAVLVSIATNYRNGTPNGISMDRESGLIFSPSHYTWMDTNHPTGTARQGYPIEIQALWFAATQWMSELEPNGKWNTLSSQVMTSISELYAPAGQPYLSDCLHAEPGRSARQAVADDAVRCNQLFAITLGAVTEPNLVRSILRTCESLLVPGGIRTLADRPVRYPLPVMFQGQTLNDPFRPYWGYYGGDEDTRRKPAYHNGTAWTWPFPSYCEALVRVYGKLASATAMSLLMSSVKPLMEGCLGQLPELLDGNAPHGQKGCGAQAWGITECYRVLAFLDASR